MWERTLDGAKAKSEGEMSQPKMKLDHILEGLECQAASTLWSVGQIVSDLGVEESCVA